MKKLLHARGAVVATVLALIVLAAPAALALGTPAGTVIQNQATVEFTDINGNPLTELSNVVSTTVSTVGGVTISPPTQSGNADPGDLVCYLHTVTNTGNDTDTIDVTTASSQAWTVSVFQDLGIPGSYEVGVDTALGDTNANSIPDTGPLAANGTMDVWICIDVPAGTSNGTVDSTDIDVDSDNDPAETDSATVTTTIDAPTLSVMKSVLPAGAQPPGTTLTYTVVIANNGNGAAENVIMTDPIPANTTYVAGTIQQDAASRTDAADIDNADFGVTNPGEVTVDVGTLAPAATTTISFQVTID